MREGDLLGWAAQLAFFFLLSLFPLLLFLMLLLGYLTGDRAQLRDQLLFYLSSLAPVSASQLIATTIEETSFAKGGGKLTVGLLAALWAASGGMRAMSKALNVAYGVRENRSWWHERLLALGLTLALGALIVVALTLLLYGSDIAEQIAAAFGLDEAFTLLWKLVQYPVAVLFVLLAFNAIYHFAPNIKGKRWKWLTPGALIGVALWLIVSIAFRQYLRQFSLIKTTYGSFGAVIALMLWCYLTGIVILIGGAVNAVINSARQDVAAKHFGDGKYK
jgi:membrane protein